MFFFPIYRQHVFIKKINSSGNGGHFFYISFSGFMVSVWYDTDRIKKEITYNKDKAKEELS